MKIKDFFLIKINFTLSVILLLIFFSFLLFFIVNIQIKIVDLRVYAAALDIVKDIKYSRYLAIVKEEPIEFKIEDNRYRLTYLASKIDYVNIEPLFKNITIKSNGNFLIKTDGTFSLKDKSGLITLESGKIKYSIILIEDGTTFIGKK